MSHVSVGYVPNATCGIKKKVPCQYTYIPRMHVSKPYVACRIEEKPMSPCRSLGVKGHLIRIDFAAALGVGGLHSGPMMAPSVYGFSQEKRYFMLKPFLAPGSLRFFPGVNLHIA